MAGDGGAQSSQAARERARLFVTAFAEAAQELPEDLDTR